MELDARIKVIENSTSIREQFSFSHPQQLIQATNISAFHLFGSNLWALYGNRAGMAWRCWDRAFKLAWRVPLTALRPFGSVHSSFLNVQYLDSPNIAVISAFCLPLTMLLPWQQKTG
jgi:hypothetical protein